MPMRMNRHLLPLLALGLMLPSALYAEGPSSASAPTAILAPAVVSVTGGAVYVFDDEQSGHNRSFWGWSAVPEVNFIRGFGVQGDISNLYVRSVYPGQSRFILAAGPRYTFTPRSRFTLFVFAEGGNMRLSTQYNPARDWNPVVLGGFGFEHRVTQGLSVTLIPGEYLGQLQDNGLWNHSFSARLGVTWNTILGRSAEH